MPWDRERAQKRIEKFVQSAPRIDTDISLTEHFALLHQERTMAKSIGQWPSGRAILVSGVHMYGVLLNFEEVATEDGEETEGSHKRVLRFLNAHYRVWDAIVDDVDANRVDYHGPRLHAVITEPADDYAAQLEQAIALADKLTQAATRVGQAYGFPSDIRFGIDVGPCLGMSTGRSHEQDILFLGSPANHAAKLAEAERSPGTFLTDRAKAALAEKALIKSADGRYQLNEQYVRAAASRHRFERIEETTVALEKSTQSDPIFTFFRPTPPLADLKFSDLMPSRTARLGVASLFADIHGFTAFVDNAINRGKAGIEHAVKSIHVLREELNSVLQDDFDGKRVRFIGDCIQGLIAEGKIVDAPADSVKAACLCSSGMRSSFSLCQETVGGIDDLDLAVGVEYGPVPVTRIGMRGEESVRCAAGNAVIVSERCQRQIEAGGLILGPVAQSVAPHDVTENYRPDTRILSYAAAADLLETHDSPVAKAVRTNPQARPHFDTRTP